MNGRGCESSPRLLPLGDAFTPPNHPEALRHTHNSNSKRSMCNLLPTAHWGKKGGEKKGAHSNSSVSPCSRPEKSAAEGLGSWNIGMKA